MHEHHVRQLRSGELTVVSVSCLHSQIQRLSPDTMVCPTRCWSLECTATKAPLCLSQVSQLAGLPTQQLHLLAARTNTQFPFEPTSPTETLRKLTSAPMSISFLSLLPSARLEPSSTSLFPPSCASMSKSVRKHTRPSKRVDHQVAPKIDSAIAVLPATDLSPLVDADDQFPMSLLLNECSYWQLQRGRLSFLQFARLDPSCHRLADFLLLHL